jgi:hypothetical protein
MVVIDRLSWLRPRYTVHDDAGYNGHLIRQRFGESATGESDGEPFEMRRAGQTVKIRELRDGVCHG